MKKSIPLYMQVHDRIMDDIQKEVYRVGEQLPAEAELAGELYVSMITIRRAMQELAHEGWVLRHPGRGTFASKPTKIEQSVSALTSFTSDMQKLGIVPSSTLLRQEIVLADRRLATIFQGDVGFKLFHLSRVRKGNEIPLILEDVYIPLDICPNLQSISFTDASLYAALTEFGVDITRSEQEFWPVNLTEEQARLLQVSVGALAFSRQALSYSGERPIEWGESVYRQDKFRFVAETGRYSPKLLLVSGANG